MFHNNISSDRWLHSSQLQKAIRRDKTTLAIASAEQLEQYHPEYLRRRLRVIALEDVGIGAPELVAQYLQESTECNSATVMQTIEAFCAAPKDRNGWAILRAAELHAWFEDDREWAMRAAPDALATTVHHTSASLYRRALAAWMLAGASRIPSAVLSSGKRDYALFLATMQALDLPPAIYALCASGSNAKDYGLGLGCAFAWLNAAPHDRQASAEPLFNDGGATFLHCAIDSHTRPGLAAIKRFCEECAPLREFLLHTLGKGIKTHMRYVAEILFYLEGANVTSRLTYSGWERPFMRALEGALCKGKFTNVQLQQLLTLITHHIDMLNALRAVLVQANFLPHN